MRKKAGSRDWEQGYMVLAWTAGLITGRYLSKYIIILCVIAATGEQRNSGRCLKLLFASLNHVSLKYSHNYTIQHQVNMQNKAVRSQLRISSPRKQG